MCSAGVEGVAMDVRDSVVIVDGYDGVRQAGSSSVAMSGQIVVEYMASG